MAHAGKDTGGSQFFMVLSETNTRHLNGVHLAMEHLVPANRECEGDGPSEISAKGKHVVIIGGGDTGADCLGTAHRQGAASVTQLDYNPQPPDARDDADHHHRHGDLGQVQVGLIDQEPVEDATERAGAQTESEQPQRGPGDVRVPGQRDLDDREDGQRRAARELTVSSAGRVRRASHRRTC